MGNIVINFTPTGMLPQKKETPHVPVTVREIVEDVQRAYALGITMVHLHAREAQTHQPSHRKEIYHEMIEGIRSFAPDLVICVSTSGRFLNEYETRSEVLSLEGPLKPDMASLTLSSLNFNQSASVNEPGMIMALADKMLEKRIKPELEIFDIGMVNYMKYLIKKGRLEPPYYTNLILGNIACAQPDLSHIGTMIKDLPKETLVAIGGVGRAQLPMNALAIAMGYGIRTGIEDNYWYDEARTMLATNHGLLSRVHEIIRANDKKVMQPVELRKKLRLAGGYGVYGAL
jgi:uncharacterized protein (DUF849 family)